MELDQIQVMPIQLPPLLPGPRSKNAPGNKTNISWKHDQQVLGNGKKVKCNYCSKTLYGEFLDSSITFVKHLKVHQVTIYKEGKKDHHLHLWQNNVFQLVEDVHKRRDLIRPSMTRFSTFYLTLTSLHELKASIMSMFSSEE